MEDRAWENKKGFQELVRFLAELRSIGFHISSALMFFIGVVLGKHISSSGIRQIMDTLGFAFEMVNPLFTFYNLPFLALNISFHNWQVSLAMALSGMIFMVPTVTTLVFNGFILGVVEDIVQTQQCS